MIQVELKDSARNSRSYPTTELEALGFPTERMVTAAPDTTPPTLVDFSFAPTTIMTLTGSVIVRASFDVDDDISGIAWIKVGFTSPGASSLWRGCTSPVFSPEGSPEGGGGFGCDIESPQFSEEGTWTVLNVEVRDVAGNSRSYPTSELALLAFPTELEVVSQSDLTAPSLIEFTFSPIGNTSAGMRRMVVSPCP